MNYLKNDSIDLDLFIVILARLVDLIGSYSMCGGVLKSINVLKNENYSGMRFIKRDIYQDFRVIYDRGQYCDDVKVVCDDIEKFLKKYFSDI